MYACCMCMYACMHACVYIYMYVGMYVCMYELYVQQYHRQFSNGRKLLRALARKMGQLRLSVYISLCPAESDHSAEGLCYVLSPICRPETSFKKVYLRLSACNSSVSGDKNVTCVVFSAHQRGASYSLLFADDYLQDFAQFTTVIFDLVWNRQYSACYAASAPQQMTCRCWLVYFHMMSNLRLCL